MKAVKGKQQTHTPRAQKVCLVCLRPFSWRKKWQRDWPNVKYCSKRCAGQRKLVQRAPHDKGDL
ncbi:DUF2256 domain-containing protein [Motilimonas pumila]|uniref:DUF2256 domain-containing protein n=1 Tax=Motilimonas pumila TaxID=2303987 RepID=A0A418YF68_9GAMM|nr:DUF2256 domain-containing protein [Motilimonas pumila]RJG47922.1 DUF2256 domain-containing protein [Motilimonas pumila]